MPSKRIIRLKFGFLFLIFLLFFLDRSRLREYDRSGEPRKWDRKLFHEDAKVSSEETNVKTKKEWPICLPPSYGQRLSSFNDSHLTQFEKSFMESYIPIMKNRLENIGEVCSRSPELSSPREFYNLVWVDRRNSDPVVSWCGIFKVGAGTWTSNFLRVAHFNENNPAVKALPPHMREEEQFSEKYWRTISTLWKIFPQPKTDKQKADLFKRAIRLMVVRHPFTRILSGYRNVIERSIPTLVDEPYYKTLRELIIEAYRSKNSTNKSEFPTFREFVHYLIEESKSFGNHSNWAYMRHNYWQPFWARCHVCASDYDVVAKLETLKEDEVFLSFLANMEEIRKKKLEKKIHQVDDTTSNELEDQYYRQLTSQQIFNLYKLYKYDFDLFQYDVEKFLRLKVKKDLLSNSVETSFKAAVVNKLS